jgi:excisionase family DNA binding protein
MVDDELEVPSLRVEQAADFLGLGKGTLDQWRHECRGPTYFKIGGQVRYRKSDLLAFIKIYVSRDQAE